MEHDQSKNIIPSPNLKTTKYFSSKIIRGLTLAETLLELPIKQYQCIHLEQGKASKLDLDFIDATRIETIWGDKRDLAINADASLNKVVHDFIEYDDKNICNIQDAVRNIFISSCNKIIVSFNDRLNILQLVEIGTGIILHSFNTFYLSFVIYSNDKNLIAFKTEEDPLTLQTYEIAIGKKLHSFNNLTLEKPVSITNNNKLIACCKDSFTIKVLDMRSGKEIFNLIGHNDCILSLTTSSNSNILVSESTQVFGSRLLRSARSAIAFIMTLREGSIVDGKRHISRHGQKSFRKRWLGNNSRSISFALRCC